MECINSEPLNLKPYFSTFSSHTNANTTQGFTSPPQRQRFGLLFGSTCPLGPIRQNQNDSETRGLSTGSYCSVMGGMLQELKSPACARQGRKTTPGRPIPLLCNIFPRRPRQSAQFTLTSFPSSFRKHSSEASPLPLLPLPPRGAGKETLSPRLGPGRRQRGGGGARAAPGTGPRLARGPPGRPKSGPSAALPESRD